MAEVTLHDGQRLHGFAVTAVTPLPEVRATGYMLEHEGTGARALHLHADDSENLFSITLPTLPPDDTGVAHILEHAVLAGSRKYPVREPFFEMLKMSMATFINAFTESDCTCYPVSSNVHKDLFNLADVYFDAVFQPLLTEETFLREGHRLAPSDPRAPLGELKTTGIVYNEMKGAFSAPETRLFMNGTAWLLPDTLYARCSGGLPEAIPDLTYEAFRDFYRTWYHPSNAYFFMYGDIPTEAYLAFLEPRLLPFSRRPAAVGIARQSPWRSHRRAEDEYPVGDGESLAEKTFIVASWLAGTATDPALAVALQVCSRILLGNEGAPLRKALIEARLGQDLAPGSGYHAIGAEAVFQVGVKGSEPDRRDRFEQVLEQTLRQLALEPIASERVDAAFQQAAYANLEVLPMFPLHMMGRVVDPWRYGVDPYTFVRMGKHLEELRRRCAQDPGFFSRFLREHLVENPHRLTLVLRPSREWQQRTDAAFAERMRGARAGLDDGAVQRIAEVSAGVESRSGTPNPPEAIALLPQLQVADVPRKPRHIPTAVETLAGGAELLRNDVFANGVNYLALDFELGGLPPELWPYMPLYQDAIHKMGAAGQGYEEIAQRVAACTGGIGCGPVLSSTAGGAGLRRLRLHLKTLDGQMEQAMSLLGDLVFALAPGNLQRLREVVSQSLAAARTRLVNDGAGTALRHASRRLGPESHLDEVAHGLPHLRLLERLAAGFDGLAEDLAAEIGRIAGRLVGGSRLTASFTGSDAAYAVVRHELGRWLERMPRHAGPHAARVAVDTAVRREGLTSPSQIAYCAQVMPAPHLAAVGSAVLDIGTHLVNGGYMLSELRLKGNAYGGGCFYDALGARIALYSYRDPHVARTLQVFSGLRDHVAGASWSQAEVDRSIIGTLKSAERPIRPGEATSTALARHVAGMTPELRQARHAEALAATPATVRAALADALERGLPQAGLCVVANRRMLEEANRELGDALAIEDILRAD